MTRPSIARGGLFALAAALTIAGIGLTASAVGVLARDPVARAADAYVALAVPLNVRLCELSVRGDAAEGLPEMRAISLEYAALHDAFAEGVAALPFPDDFGRDAGLAVDAARRVAALHRQASGAAAHELRGIGDELGRALDAQRAVLSRIRLRLRLDPLPRAIPDEGGRCTTPG